MKAPTAQEVLLERLAILDQHIESLRLRSEAMAKGGPSHASPDAQAGLANTTLGTLLETREVLEKFLAVEIRSEPSVGRSKPAQPLPASEGKRPQPMDGHQACAVLLHAAELCARRGAKLEHSLNAMLDAAVELAGAQTGSIQLVTRGGATLRMAAQRGLGGPFLQTFKVVIAGDATSCGLAMSTRGRVVVENVGTSHVFTSRKLRQAFMDAGIAAVTSIPLLGSDGAVLGVMSTHFAVPHTPDGATLSLLDLLARLASDFLERLKWQEELESAATQLRQTFENAAIGLTRCSRDLRYVAANEPYARIAGVPLAGIEGRHILDVLGADAFETIQPYIERVLYGERVEYEEEVCFASGRRRWLHVVYAPWRDGDSIVGWLASIADVTDRRLAEDGLRAAEHRKDEFLATLAHELRNPLAPIRTGVDLLRLDGHPGQSRLLDVMERQVTRLTRLVDELMDISRIARGTLELKSGRTDLAEVIRQAADMVGPAIEAAGIRLIQTLPDGPVVVTGDAMRLGQIFANLLDNASKYGLQDGFVEVSLACVADRAIAKVRDNGIGIPVEMLPHVFELFTQGTVPSDRRVSGLGIGLALVRTLVELHGGGIDVYSDGPNSGSMFEVWLPLAEGSAEAPLGPARSSIGAIGRALEGRRIIVVDDNRDAANATAEFLRALGAEVHAVYRGVDAVAAVREHAPEVAFLDLGMPGMDGFAVARAIQADSAGRSVRLVALSAWGQREHMARTRKAGFYRHLVKPAEPEEMVAAVLDEVDQSRTNPTAR